MEPHQGLGDNELGNGSAVDLLSQCLAGTGDLPAPADTHRPKCPRLLPGSLSSAPERKVCDAHPQSHAQSQLLSQAAPRGLGAEGQQTQEEDTWEKLPGPEAPAVPPLTRVRTFHPENPASTCPTQ